MGVRMLDAAAVRRTLAPTGLVDALEEAFRRNDPSGAPLRTVLETDRGRLLLMPAWGTAGVGVKLVTLTPDNPAAGEPFIGALYVLFDPITQQPAAVLDGAELTARRTAAVSALATRHLARPDAHRLVVFGAGVQARAHVEAMRAVRPIDEVVVIARTPAHAEELVRAVDGIEARVGAPEDVASADIVCTCTTSPDPVVRGASLSAGVHVNAVGAYTPATRELDTEAVRRARILVETRQAALAEAGDLLIPIEEGAIGPEHVQADLHALLNGAEVRVGPEDVTVFVSVGLAFEDLAVAAAIVDAVGR
jgi:ornithine cyclodeaminase/alanine dehydrogenase-like protein (mu-crystallin family)